MSTPAQRLSGRPATREAIFDAALRCFERQGIAATGMEEIAAEASVSRAALYYHFANKRDLILEVIARRGAEILDTMREEIAFQPATLELVTTAMTRQIELTLADPITSQAAAPELELVTAELLVSERMVAVHRSFWAPLLTAAIESGEMRADLQVDDVIAWITFLMFALANVGERFGLLERERLRVTLERFLAPALRRK